MPERFLLDPAGLLHRFQPKPDHVEGVEHGGGVVEFVADRVAVAAERVQGGRAGPGGERLAAGVQLVGVGSAGPAGHQVEQPGPRLPVAPGQIHHACHLFVPLPGLGAGGARCARRYRSCRPRPAGHTARRRLSHRRGPSVTDAWSQPILKDLEPPGPTRPTRASVLTPENSEEPVIRTPSRASRIWL